MDSVVRNPNTAVPSCFGSGKDWVAAHIAAWWVSTGGILVATSNSFPQLRDIFWRELRKAHTAGNLPVAQAKGNDLRWEIEETGAFAIRATRSATPASRVACRRQQPRPRS